MKLYRIIHENLNYHTKQILWSENKHVCVCWLSGHQLYLIGHEKNINSIGQNITNSLEQK